MLLLMNTVSTDNNSTFSFKTAEPSDIANFVTRVTGTTFYYYSYNIQQPRFYGFEELFKQSDKFYRIIFNLENEKWTLYKVFKDNYIEKIMESEFMDVVKTYHGYTSGDSEYNHQAFKKIRI